MYPVHQLITFVWCLILIWSQGCERAAPVAIQRDGGPLYVAPSGTGAANIDGVNYEYVATKDRETQITKGFHKLNIGQSRQDVRDALGSPDSAEPSYGKEANPRLRGWCYMYKIRMRAGSPNTNDVCVEVFFFDPVGKIHWAVPENITGLNEIGQAEDDPPPVSL